MTAQGTDTKLLEEEKKLPRPSEQIAEVAGKPKSDTSKNSHDVKTILEWSAPGRPFRKKGKQYYLTALLIMLFVEVILFLFSEYILMLVVLSIVFVAFALATIAPGNFKYRISTEGITIEDHFFLWQELYDFYFKKREGVDVIHIRTHSFIPGELTITLGDHDLEKVKAALLPYLPYREYIKPTFMEKSSNWLTHNFPLEKSR
jgi:predicted DNA binding CopG/RHH family protein